MRIAVAHPVTELRRRITEALRRDGHLIAELCNAEELVTCLSTWTLEGRRPDLLVLSDRLGSRSGMEVAAGIRGTAWDAPVVLVLDYDGLPAIQAELEQVEAVFVTPIDVDELRTVAQCLRRRGDGDDGRVVAPAMPEPAGLRVELTLRDVPPIEGLVDFVRERVTRLGDELGIRGRCCIRIETRWRRALRYYVVDVELEALGQEPVRLARSDLGPYQAITEALDALGRIAESIEDELWEHDGWSQVRRRPVPLVDGLDLDDEDGGEEQQTA